LLLDVQIEKGCGIVISTRKKASFRFSGRYVAGIGKPSIAKALQSPLMEKDTGPFLLQRGREKKKTAYM